MKLPPRLALPALLALAGAVAAVGFARPGCTKPPAYKQPDTEARAAENPWPGVVAQLRKDNDPTGCRTVLMRLNNDLAQAPTAPQPTGLTPEGEKSLRE
jgi:hypothetical protein